MKLKARIESESGVQATFGCCRTRLLSSVLKAYDQSQRHIAQNQKAQADYEAAKAAVDENAKLDADYAAAAAYR